MALGGTTPPTRWGRPRRGSSARPPLPTRRSTSAGSGTWRTSSGEYLTRDREHPRIGSENIIFERSEKEEEEKRDGGWNGYTPEHRRSFSKSFEEATHGSAAFAEDISSHLSE